MSYKTASKRRRFQFTSLIALEQSQLRYFTNYRYYSFTTRRLSGTALRVMTKINEVNKQTFLKVK